ncbi:hypothetical protein [Caloramator sp. Dgby_cultured_2]|uniref:hypothetical protein n=1 Tax=Caloramator sp. Dgby_cultured_2 TaxID=3029174 RepID=UPI00406CFE8D
MKKDKIIIKKGQVNLTIATIDERFIFSIIRGLLKRKNLPFMRENLMLRRFMQERIQNLINL